jgi:hypothetical protein
MQFGFRSGVGTIDAFLLLNIVAKSFPRIHGMIGYTCFVDLQKAFPSVYRSKVIESLRLSGAPSNTVRALASSWSMNSCKLRINSFLSKPFLINRGVKEGGINSPTVFSVVYARALNMIGVDEAPMNLRHLDPERVYYFAFADDLALFSGNFSKVEEALDRLNNVLPEFGMKMNLGKTCWLPFLPTNSRFRVAEPDRFSLCVRQEELDCVDEFKYLGYTVTSFLSSQAHLALKGMRCSGQVDQWADSCETFRLRISNLSEFIFTLLFLRNYMGSSVSISRLMMYTARPSCFYRRSSVYLISDQCCSFSPSFASVRGHIIGL